jgi:hypothetical protein
MELEGVEIGGRCRALQQLILARLRLDIEDPLGLTFIINSCDHLLQFVKCDNGQSFIQEPGNPVSSNGSDLVIQGCASPADNVSDFIPAEKLKEKLSFRSGDDGTAWSVKKGSKSWSASEILGLRLHYDKQNEVQDTNNPADLMPQPPRCAFHDQDAWAPAIKKETISTLTAIKKEALRIIDRQLIRVSSLSSHLPTLSQRIPLSRGSRFLSSRSPASVRLSLLPPPQTELIPRAASAAG